VHRRGRPQGTTAHILSRYEKNDTCARALARPGNKTAQSPKGRLRGGGMKASDSSESPEGDSDEYQVSELLHKIKQRRLAGVARRGLRRISYQDTKKKAFIQVLCTPQGTKQRSPLKGDYAVAEILCGSFSSGLSLFYIMVRTLSKKVTEAPLIKLSRSVSRVAFSFVSSSKKISLPPLKRIL